MASLNSCSFTGRAGRDPEVRYFEDGTSLCNLSIAVDSWKRDADPLWLNCVIRGKQAQVAADYVRKGSLIGVTGELENDTWTDRATGEEKSKLVLSVNSLKLLESRRDGGGGDSQAEAQPRAQRQSLRRAAPSPAPSSLDEEEVPF
jgi:single-strand DNA-binding protein